MKKFYVLLVVVLATLRLEAQMADDLQTSTIRSRSTAYAPAMLFTNGMGQFFPIKSGETVRVGGTYLVMPIPARGYVFNSWERVDAFVFTAYSVNGSGGIDSNTSVVLSPIPTFFKDPFLLYTVEPEKVLYDEPGVETVIQSEGWIANFVPVK